MNPVFLGPRKDPSFAIGLLIPPAYDRWFPPLGTAALAGYLKARGIEASQEDLNLRFFEYLRRNRLEGLSSASFRKKKITQKTYYSELLQLDEKAIGPSYPHENLPGCSFDFTAKLLSSPYLHRYLQDEKENPFVLFTQRDVFPRARKKRYEMIGISITSPSQVVAGFTLGYFLKQMLPALPIVIGGQWVSFYREELQKRGDFAAFYDYLIFFEGETPFYRLILALRNQSSFSDVPNLVYREKGKWIFSPKVSFEDVDQLPTPDFDGLPLQKYWGRKKGIALPFETSRGCYWNRCVFCIDLPLPKPPYRERSPDLVIRDIQHLINKYKLKRLIISNATFSPGQLREVCQRILRERIRIQWWAFARLDEEFDRQTLRLAKKAGCFQLGFGLESMNQRVLDFLDKGTKVEVIKRIITEAREVKLNIYFQVILGLPSEKKEEALDTIGFLMRSPDIYTTHVAFNPYYLIPKNRVFLNPKKFGLKIFDGRSLPFRYYYKFKHISGNVDQELASQLMSLYQRVVAQRRAGRHPKKAGG